MFAAVTTVVSLIFLPVLALSQPMVKVNPLDLYGLVPPPPKTVEEAYSRAKCTVNGDINSCDTKDYYKKINVKLDQIGQQVEKTNVALSVHPTPAMANVDPQEMERKMATMNPEEKMKFAMAMMQQMNLGPKALTPEPEAVQEAVEEYTRLASGNIRALLDRSEKKNEIDRGRDRKHQEIDAWVETEIGKLPYVDFSEAGRFKDQKKVFAIQAKAAEKHIAAENDYLATMQKYWNDLMLEHKSSFTKLQQKLAAIKYGDEAKNIETKRTLIGAQQLMLSPVPELIAVSREATNNAINWWTQKLRLEQQKSAN